MFNNELGSKDIAQMRNVSQRAVNYMKNREGFPSIRWIGRTWRVDRNAYEAWRVIESDRKLNKNA